MNDNEKLVLWGILVVLLLIIIGIMPNIAFPLLIHIIN